MLNKLGFPHRLLYVYANVVNVVHDTLQPLIHFKLMIEKSLSERDHLIPFGNP